MVVGVDGGMLLAVEGLRLKRAGLPGAELTTNVLAARDLDINANASQHAHTNMFTVQLI